MNALLPVILELLAAAPSIAKDLTADAQAWHESHGWTQKTVAAAATAAQLSEALSTIAKAAGSNGD